MAWHDLLVFQVGQNVLKGHHQLLPLIQAGLSFLDQCPYLLSLRFAQLFEYPLLVGTEGHETGVFQHGNWLIEGPDDFLAGIVIVFVLSEILGCSLDLANCVVIGARFFGQRQHEFQIFHVVKLDEVGDGE